MTRLDASTGTVTVAETAASSVCGCEASSVAADVEYVTAFGVEQVPTPTSCGTTDANAQDAVQSKDELAYANHHQSQPMLNT